MNEPVREGDVDTASDQPVSYRSAGAVVTITLNSPANRNALSPAMRGALRSALDRAATEPEARVVVLDHTGSAFCAGMDLKESAGAIPGAEGVRELPDLLQRIAACARPVIAKVHGAVRGGGVGVVAACDIVLAASSATFAFSEVRVGLVPAVISVAVLRRMAAAAARELLLTGEVFDAVTAQRAGLVNAVADTIPDPAPQPGDDPALDALVAHYVDALSRGGPSALALTKAMLRDPTTDIGSGIGTATGTDPRYEQLLEYSARQFGTAEAREGALAFAQKRRPKWVPGVTG